MLNVLRSYVPLFVWLFLVAVALRPSLSSASEPDGLDAALAAAQSLIAQERWAEAARLAVPRSEPGEKQSRLLFARGLGAARAGYRGMAWHSVERLEGLRDDFLARGHVLLARDADERARRLAEAIVPEKPVTE